jgi:phosphatidylinositol kinase/protein kinase (PI-3  family)
VTGIEGVFRIACEITMQLLRDNKDPLMSVLDAFIHDPLVEWEDETRKRVRQFLPRVFANDSNFYVSSNVSAAMPKTRTKTK